MVRFDHFDTFAGSFLFDPRKLGFRFSCTSDKRAWPRRELYLCPFERVRAFIPFAAKLHNPRWPFVDWLPPFPRRCPIPYRRTQGSNADPLPSARR